MAVQYERKQTVLRYELGKVRLEEILKRFGATKFTVSPAGPVTAIVRQERATVKAWAEPAAPGTALFVELIPAEGSRLGAKSAVSLPHRPPAPGLKLVMDAEVVPQDPKSGSRRFRFRLATEGASKGGEIAVPVEFRYEMEGRPFSGEIAAPLLLEDPAPAAQSSGVALVGGMLELGLGHLCDQRGCVDHFHKSIQALPGLVGVRPRPGLKDPGATVYIRAGRPIDVWALRQELRDRGVEVRRLAARDLGPLTLHLQLRRWEKGGDASQCLSCLERAVQAVRSVPWAAQAAAADGGMRIRLREGEPDLVALLDALEGKGAAPSAVWLVPDPASAPAPSPAAIARLTPEPKRGGSEAHPRVHLDFDHECTGGAALLEVLGRQEWASRTGQAAGTMVASVGDRRHADLVPLLRDLRAAGRQPDRIRLSGFGQLRLQVEFAHLCGEVEYSKPPAPKEKKPSDGDKKDPPQAEPPKPFVPQPLRPAPSSAARQAVEKAVAGVGWIQEAAYPEYCTRPEFNGPRRLLMALVPSRAELVRPDELIRALAAAGFPPVAVRVSRTFAGLGFGERLPGDLELVAADGEKRLLSSFRRDGRPLAVGFVSLNCPKWDKYKYEADPGLYRKLKETVEACGDRADFVAISSNSDDPFPRVTEFWERAGLGIPLLRDAEGLAASVLNAQVTPPPHWYLFDGEGRLRYAGDAHDNWDKPAAVQRDYLREALDLVLAGKVAGNGAVFFNSAKCNCSSPKCACPKCGCGSSCRCAVKHCKVGF